MKLTNKKLIAAAGIYCVALAISGNAIAKGPHGNGFGRIDTDASGTIELQEWIDHHLAKVNKRFEKIDIDEDGLISLEEYLAAGREPAVDLSPYAEELVECVADLALENDDIEVPDASHFQSLEDKFDEKDLDDDGFISLSEAETSATENATESFESIDADADGSLTREDLKANKNSRKATRRAIRTCVDELLTEDEVI